MKISINSLLSILPLRNAKCLLVMSVLVLSACTQTAPYRKTSDSVCVYNVPSSCYDQALTKAVTKKGHHYALNFFEFDDQGYLHNSEEPYSPKTKDNVLNHIRNTADNKDVFMLVFVHGWHHDARGKKNKEDANIIEFRKILSTAADALAGTKDVIGVYVGWRGDSIRVPLLDSFNLVNTLTFWDRKNTAHEIGSQGMTTFLLELEDSLKASGRDGHRMLSIGHSFGAAALYSGVNHILKERIVRSRPFGTTNTIEGFGDLVVLLNPAFEGIKYSSLFGLTQYGCLPYPNTQKEKLLIISSSADWAVRYAFPTGRRLNTLFESHENTSVTHCTTEGPKEYILDTSYTDRYSVGHNTFYTTHILKSNVLDSLKTMSDEEIIKRYQRPEVESFGRNNTRFSLTELTSENITVPNNPILNVYTDGTVMSGHNDIWNEKITEILYVLIGDTIK